MKVGKINFQINRFFLIFIAITQFSFFAFAGPEQSLFVKKYKSDIDICLNAMESFLTEYILNSEAYYQELAHNKWTEVVASKKRDDLAEIEVNKSETTRYFGNGYKKQILTFSLDLAFDPEIAEFPQIQAKVLWYVTDQLTQKALAILEAKKLSPEVAFQLIDDLWKQNELYSQSNKVGNSILLQAGKVLRENTQIDELDKVRVLRTLVTKLLQEPKRSLSNLPDFLNSINFLVDTLKHSQDNSRMFFAEKLVELIKASYESEARMKIDNSKNSQLLSSDPASKLKLSQIRNGLYKGLLDLANKGGDSPNAHALSLLIKDIEHIELVKTKVSEAHAPMCSKLY